MDPREIVRRTLDFEGPERVARTFGDSDLIGAAHEAKTLATKWTETGGGAWERIDEWGNRWRRLDATSKGEVQKGVLDDLADAERLTLPDFSRPEDYAAVARARAAQPDKWLMGLMPGFAFNLARKMRRLDQYLMDLVTEPAAIHRLHNRLDEMLIPMIENYARAGADSVFFLEDWGTQQHLMINPRLWHEEFFPRYQRLCRVAHEAGIRVFMHSCGKIAAIIPGVMAAGVDLLQFDQPDLYGIDNLAAFHAQGQISFWCPVDIQSTLQTRDEALIRAKSREMLAKLWRGRGGFIAGYYEDNASIGLDPAVQGWASDEFERVGRKENFSAIPRSGRAPNSGPGAE
jgi:uroporphyrinogen decarboxylase